MPPAKNTPKPKQNDNPTDPKTGRTFWDVVSSASGFSSFWFALASVLAVFLVCISILSYLDMIALKYENGLYFRFGPDSAKINEEKTKRAQKEIEEKKAAAEQDYSMRLFLNINGTWSAEWQALENTNSYTKTKTSNIIFKFLSFDSINGYGVGRAEFIVKESCSNSQLDSTKSDEVSGRSCPDQNTSFPINGSMKLYSFSFNFTKKGEIELLMTQTNCNVNCDTRAINLDIWLSNYIDYKVDYDDPSDISGVHTIRLTKQQQNRTN